MYKFAMRDVSYNARLFKMKQVDTPNCKWCPGVRESLLHLYWYCPKATTLWKYVETITSTILGKNIELGMTKTLFYLRELSNIKKPIIGDVLVSLTKYYIHCAKCKEFEPNVLGLERYITSIKKMERSVAIAKGTLQQFNQR